MEEYPCFSVRVQHGHVKVPLNDTHIACEVLGSLDTGLYTLTWYRNDQEVTEKKDKYILKPEENALIIQKVGK